MKTPRRSDGRRPGDLRPVTIETGCLKFAAGSALMRAGDTCVLCSASIQESVPDFLKGKGSGWLTAEYGMLPASTPQRKSRETFKPDGRSIEIRRLIGRALRMAVDLKQLGERTLWLDCDVLQADGGTRTLAVTGAWVALALAVRKLRADGLLTADPLREQVAAVSVGIVDGVPVLDLPYVEDSRAEVDMNVVMTRAGRFIEVQGTAEKQPFDEAQLARLLALARKGCGGLMRMQSKAVNGKKQK